MNSNDEDDMEMLFESIHTLYTTYKQYNGLTRALTSRERKYLIMGFALHLIGDIYAHRGCVPSIYASDSYFNNYINPESVRLIARNERKTARIQAF